MTRDQLRFVIAGQQMATVRVDPYKVDKDKDIFYRTSFQLADELINYGEKFLTLNSKGVEEK